MTGRIRPKHGRSTRAFEAYAAAQCDGGRCGAQLAAGPAEMGGIAYAAIDINDIRLQSAGDSLEITCTFGITAPDTWPLCRPPPFFLPFSRFRRALTCRAALTKNGGRLAPGSPPPALPGSRAPELVLYPGPLLATGRPRPPFRAAAPAIPRLPHGADRAARDPAGPVILIAR